MHGLFPHSSLTWLQLLIWCAICRAVIWSTLTSSRMFTHAKRKQLVKCNSLNGWMGRRLKWYSGGWRVEVRRRRQSELQFWTEEQAVTAMFAVEELNPFTPKSDQYQISPAASPEMLHGTVWRTWLFKAYTDERWLYYRFSLPRLYIVSVKGWESIIFELGSERVSLDVTSPPGWPHAVSIKLLNQRRS